MVDHGKSSVDREELGGKFGHSPVVTFPTPGADSKSLLEHPPKHVSTPNTGKVVGITIASVGGVTIAILAIVCAVKMIRRKPKAKNETKTSSNGSSPQNVQYRHLGPRPGPQIVRYRPVDVPIPVKVVQLTNEEPPVSPPDASPPSDYEVLRIEPVRSLSRSGRAAKGRSRSTGQRPTLTEKRPHDLAFPAQSSKQATEPSVRHLQQDGTDSQTEFSTAATQFLSPRLQKPETSGHEDEVKNAADGQEETKKDKVRQTESLAAAPSLADDYAMVSSQDAPHPDSPFGDIVFSFQYIPAKEAFHVQVIKAVGLRRPESSAPPSPYVKVLLYARGSRDSDSSAMTNVVDGNPNPVFETLCVFAHYTCPWLMAARMKLKVLHCKSPILRKKNPRIGEVVVDFSAKRYNFLEKTTLSLSLQPSKR